MGAAPRGDLIDWPFTETWAAESFISFLIRDNTEAGAEEMSSESEERWTLRCTREESDKTPPRRMDAMLDLPWPPPTASTSTRPVVPGP